jgi:two-component sensor histidine kinase
MKVPGALLTSVFLLPAFGATAQTWLPALPSLIVQYQHSGRDTNRVRLLLKIDSLYLFQLPDETHIFDSALLMSKQARDLSFSLHFDDGKKDADFLMGATYVEMNELASALSFINQMRGSVRVHLLIKLGEHYLFRPGGLKENSDSAYAYILLAKAAADSLGSIFWISESLNLMGKYRFTVGDLPGAGKCYAQIIDGYHHMDDQLSQAHWWEEYARYMPDTDSTYSRKLYASQKALDLYSQLKDVKDQASVIGAIAYLHSHHLELDKAEAEYMQQIELRKIIGDNSMTSIYYGLAQIHLAKGNYNSALYYSLQAARLEDSSGDGRIGEVFFQLAESYRALGETDKSLHWYKLAQDNLIEHKAEVLFSLVGRMTHAILNSGQPGKALSGLQTFVRNNPPPRFIDKEIVAQCLGDCYMALGRYDLAETHYLRMIALADTAQAHQIMEVSPIYTVETLTRTEANYTIGRFYTSQGRYRLASVYLEKALSPDRFAPQLSLKADTYGLLFKIDSAEKNYLSAIGDFRLEQTLRDSIFSIVKSRQIAEMSVKYESDKKEEENRILNGKEQLQGQALQKSALVHKFSFALVMSLVVLLSIGYSRYRLKQKSNRHLKAHQVEIDVQYRSLQDLMIEQETLLGEKERLVKEIHHRVKNNLQVIISLLNAQSDFLDHPVAINAIQQSSERIRAIALLHQHLYEPEQNAWVDMCSYVREMIAYLVDSFSPSSSSRFRMDIQLIRLDISQAAPLGLILNEVLTNAARHAFPGDEAGTISIFLHCLDDGYIYLKIAYNGDGSPEQLDFPPGNSLAFELITLFAEQLEGDLQFKKENGFELSLTFKKASPRNNSPD